ncbi:MAG TPA: ABC transporter ATP-binding protein [Rhodospirillaceae bacterium]|nr:ABC transporter ATP-binding protein [Rhodospirillaceae bacterium]
MSNPVLEALALHKAFRGLVAVDEVSFSVREGTVHALIGPNGAGKTTLFNLVSGLLPVSAGSLRFLGQDITGLAAHARARRGIGRTFQNIRIFASMTVLENVMTGMSRRLRQPWPLVLLRGGAAGREEATAKQRAHHLLDLVGISEQADRPAADLAYGDQRRLEIARALAGEPQLLLLDEPAAGMNPTETAGLMALLQKLRTDGLTILLVEHDMGFVMELSDQITVLNFGRVICEGQPEAVQHDPAVVEAYLGPKVAQRLLAAKAVKNPQACP